VFGAAVVLPVGMGLPAQADTTPAAGDAKRGEELFAANGCGWCHANAGRTAGKGPQLAGTSRDDSFIRFRITHGKEGAMPAFGNAFKDAQIADLIAYIRSLKDQ
jgi:mono/diheme cytochrome c family protein